MEAGTQGVKKDRPRVGCSPKPGASHCPGLMEVATVGTGSKGAEESSDEELGVGEERRRNVRWPRGIGPLGTVAFTSRSQNTGLGLQT